MIRDTFEQLVRETIDSLPAEFKNVMNNVDVVIEEEPTLYQRRKMRLRPWTTLFGLYEGIPQTQRRNYAFVLPDKITIFQGPIERSSLDEESIKEQVKRTVLHEIGHHFGLTDAEIRKAGK